MTTRIDARFAELKREGRAAFITFLMAGDPDIDTSLAIIKALPKAGADVIEIGMPFTDPMADGPAIQASGLRALKTGMTLKKALALVRDFRVDDDATPVVLMGYYNPIYIYGVDKFIADAKIAGVDGLILVDLPAEDIAAVTEAVARIKRHTRLPVCVGFGIRTPEAARAIAENADGAVVGTALVDALRGSLDAGGRATAKTVDAVGDLVASLAQGVRGAKQAAE